ncbi:LysR family transcriptional regulator [Nissabacter sp. SGAir0207]|uniref:LysR family transcriptional regulator n=1 Tax=Nissabacter sp. SGAir0207 TaxID=2126321 RepID=UPI0010CD0064|nr:LysR family transcriptional regulator [Nissabacter sp. SGAir0207]QCR38428.1 LysR family transcriptional regulator [Nissabacter sp. SGAir0207]
MTSLHDLDLKQLEAFATVISAGSVTAAAKVLDRSQPAVSRLIQELEQSLGYPLFVRNGPRIHPTEEALQLHQYVQKALQSLQQIRQRALEIGHQQQRPLNIAATPALAAGLLPQALAALDLQTRVQIVSESAEHTTHAVITGEADVGLCSLPLEHHAVELHWIGQSRCVVALPQEDPLAAQATLDLASLAGRRLITPWSPLRLRGRFEKALKRVKAAPHETIETNSSANILACVRAGLGVAILEPVTAWGMPLQGVAIRPLEEDIPYFFGVITPQGRQISAAAQGLIAALAEAAAALLPAYQQLPAGEHHRVMRLINQA